MRRCHFPLDSRNYVASSGHGWMKRPLSDLELPALERSSTSGSAQPSVPGLRTRRRRGRRHPVRARGSPPVEPKPRGRLNDSAATPLGAERGGSASAETLGDRPSERLTTLSRHVSFHNTLGAPHRTDRPRTPRGGARVRADAGRSLCSRSAGSWPLLVEVRCVRGQYPVGLLAALADGIGRWVTS